MVIVTRFYLATEVACRNVDHHPVSQTVDLEDSRVVGSLDDHHIQVGGHHEIILFRSAVYWA